MKFEITTKDGRKFISSNYKDIKHIHENASQYEGGVFCSENTFVGFDRISLIEPLKEEIND